MERIFNHPGLFPGVAILAAFLPLSVIPVGTPDASEARAAKPVVVRLRAGLTNSEIQRALDSLPGAGGEVVLSAGEYLISRPVVLGRDNQILCGEGPATLLRLADDADCPVIVMGEPVNRPSRTVRHLLVSGLSIDGNRMHQRSEVWEPGADCSEIRNNGITVQGVRDSAVVNVTCAHCRSGGMVTTLGVKRLRVLNLEAFDNEFDGLACYSTEDCRFDNLNLHNNCSAGISLDLDFDHNRIRNAVLADNDLGIFMRSSRSNRFESVSVRGSRHFGVFIAQADIETPRGWRPVANTECTGNLFVDLVTAHCGDEGFHVNDRTCTNNRVTGTRPGGADPDDAPAGEYTAF
jgi:hypothetical protein